MERRLHGPLDEQVWETLKEAGHVGEILRDEDALNFGQLLDLYEQEERRAERYRAGYEPAKPQGRQILLPRRPSRPPELEPAERPTELEPIEQILAVEASRREDVRAFRAIVLGGSPLKNDSFDTAPDGWTLERMKKAKLHAIPERSPEFLWQQGPYSTPEESRRVLDEYVSGQRAIAGQGRAARELDFLWCLVDVLMDEYSWEDPVDVEHFVLADRPPRLVVVTRAYLPGASEATTGRYVFHVSALTSPRELMRVYSDERPFMARLRHLPQRFRAAGPRKQELAVFVARYNDGRPWKAMMELWNEEHSARPDADPHAGELTPREKGRILRLTRKSRTAAGISREEAKAKVLAERADGQRIVDSQDTFSDAGEFARRARDAYLTVMGKALDYAGELPADDEEIAP